MEISRRSFLVATGATGTGALLGSPGLDLRPTVACASQTILKRDKVFTTICPYCGVGCGAVVEVDDAGMINFALQNDRVNKDYARHYTNGPSAATHATKCCHTRSADYANRISRSGYLSTQ